MNNLLHMGQPNCLLLLVLLEAELLWLMRLVPRPRPLVLDMRREECTLPLGPAADIEPRWPCNAKLGPAIGCSDWCGWWCTDTGCGTWPWWWPTCRA